MNRYACYILLLLFVVLSSCVYKIPEKAVKAESQGHDIRNSLNPKRLTIAMWDFSWLYMHHPGGTFENFGKALDELVERDFNTVRIDAFPMIIGKLKTEEEQVTIEGDSLRNWGPTNNDYKHNIVAELIEFMRLCKEKGINVILSTWNFSCLEYPDLIKEYSGNMRKYWDAWNKTLNILERENLLNHVVYVDLDQEFPYFSPFNEQINYLGKIPKLKNNMEAAGQIEKLQWNNAQLKYVKQYLESSLKKFQNNYPELRFTFSFTSYWREVRSLNIKHFDVLELHIWLTQMERFNSRTGFGNLKKDRGENDYKDYMQRLNATMKSVRPMLLKEMHNKMQFAKDWSDEIAAPLTTTESWGPWWHMDHPDLEWQWLYEWCEECMDISNEYNFWGVTPWNYSLPYWKNWQNIKWYKKNNYQFLNK